MDGRGAFMLKQILAPLQASEEPAAAQKQTSDGQVYDHILIHVFQANIRSTRQKVEVAMRLLKPGGTVAIFIQHLNGEFHDGDFSFELAQYASQILVSNWMGYQVSAQFVGGRTKRYLRRLEASLFKRVFPARTRLQSSAASSNAFDQVRWLAARFRAVARRLLVAVAAVLVYVVVLALRVANNLRLRNSLKACPEYCSSVLIAMKSAATSEAASFAAPTGKTAKAEKVRPKPSYATIESRGV